MKKILVAVGAFVVGFGLMAAAKNDVQDPNIVILNKNNVATLSDEVNGNSVGDTVSQLRGLKETKEPIYLFMDTPGGSIQSGLELIEALKGSSRQIKTITSFAASMGFQIVQNANERLILKNGVLMAHKARGQVDGEFGGKGPSQMDNRLNFWKQRLQDLDIQTVNRSNGKQTIESYQNAYENELWLTGTQAVEQGYADRVVVVKCDASLDGVNTRTTTFFGMEVQYDIDKCPLSAAPKNIRMKIETTRGIMDIDEFVKQGGIFGAACLMSQEPGKLCLIDTSITPGKIKEIKQNFVNNYVENKNKVVYMTIGN